MLFKFCFQFECKCSTRDIWEEIKGKGVNLLDLGNMVFIYGETGILQLNKILKTCCAVGTLNGSVKEWR